MEEIELLGTRSTTRATTMALSPRLQLLAVGTAARPHAGWDGGNSSLDILGLWEMDEEPERGRELVVVASIPAPSNRPFHRLAWSASDASNSAHPYGLLAGALDDGVVYVWDPYKLDYFAASASLHLHLPQVNNPTGVNIKENASEMSRDVERIYMDQLDETLDGWYIVEENCEAEIGDWELINMKPAALLEHKSSGVRADPEGPLLKIADLEGPVRGLGFNNQYPNVLAAASKADKLNIYHIDYPVRDFTSKYEFADASEKAKNARVTFLEWNPQYPAMLASTSDAGIITIWDIRRKKPTLRFEDKNQQCTEVRWSPKDPLQFAVSSIGESSHTVKIWNLAEASNNYLKLPFSEFGPKRGVTTLSWSADDLILTTDVGGGTTCWSVGSKESVELSGEVSGSLEAHWCEIEHEFVVSTTTGVKLCKLLRPPVAL